MEAEEEGGDGGGEERSMVPDNSPRSSRRPSRKAPNNDDTRRRTRMRSHRRVRQWFEWGCRKMRRALHREERGDSASLYPDTECNLHRTHMEYYRRRKGGVGGGRGGGTIIPVQVALTRIKEELGVE